jgi:hypothetical protein
MIAPFPWHLDTDCMRRTTIVGQHQLAVAERSNGFVARCSGGAVVFDSEIAADSLKDKIKETKNWYRIKGEEAI